MDFNNHHYSLNPERTQPDNSSNSYSLNIERIPQDSLTPRSAVSSFNIPAQYDRNLQTPVSMTSSPSLGNKAMLLRNEPEIKLSPTSQMFNMDDDSSPVLAHPSMPSAPMKYKSESMFTISTRDSTFPSPLVPAEPFYGGLFTVSAGRPSDSPQNLQPAPTYSSAQTTTSIYSPEMHAPLLISPHPHGFRPRQEASPHRQNSLQSNESVQSAPSRLHPASFPEVLRSTPPKKKARSHDLNFYNSVISSPDLNEEEKMLLRLTVFESLPWKETQKKFNECLGKQYRVPALQMKKGRLIKRIKDRARMNVRETQNRNWGPVAPVVRYPSQEIGSRDDAGYISDYETMSRNHRRLSSSISVGQRAWSDGSNSVTHSPSDDGEQTLMPTFSPQVIAQARSRSGSGASSHLQLLQQEHHHQQHQQHQQQQQQPIYGQQQQQQQQQQFDELAHARWNSGA